ncbi:DUF1735 domain-containing protein [Mucilaginibacter mali]|uniref:DUF1735 domain-containing protein n=1 Tax=Mucilaginibacter mali TaxID=2740462 RepID=A0A7D4TMC2_9SPHI|nr:DUF1735 domain-containing protein [Mucilaginibacter mali]QKJ29014.1 DUF1735 domain-containing protein [Mucilaginibacter mali]
MKRNLIHRYQQLAAIVLIGIAFASCKKQASYDFNGDSDNKVYLTAGTYNGLAYSGYNFSVANTPGGIVGAVSAAIPVHSTLSATNDIQVKVTTDNTLVGTFNAKTGGTAIAVPDGAITLSSNLTIPAGQVNSKDSLKLSIASDKLATLAPGTYVVPLRISSANNASVSANQNVTYVYFTLVATNCYPSPAAADMTGAIVATRTGWTATLDATPTSGALANMFDAKTNTSWSLNPPKACTMTVDMAATRNAITGVRIHTSSTTYSVNTAVISTSTDGTNWTAQGTATLLNTSAYEYVKFYSPVNARYIRMNITAWKSATQIILTEFDIYQ